MRACLKCTSAISEEEAIHGFHAGCFQAEFEISQLTDFRDLFERSSQTGPKGVRDPAFRKFNSSFFHGRYRKYSGTLESKNYIIKVQQPEFPELPAIEFVSNQIARLLGLHVPSFHFIHFRNQAFAFLSRNLMDIHAPATLDHIYKFVATDSQFNCETLSQIILSETGRLSEVQRFVELCLFDALIGNNDRHGRNLALITKSGGTRILSPFYDNPSYIGIADPMMFGTDIQPRGTIATATTGEPTLKDYVEEFNRLGHSQPIERFGQRVTSKAAAIFSTIRSSVTLSKERAASLVTLIEKRLQEFENG